MSFSIDGCDVENLPRETADELFARILDTLNDRATHVITSIESGKDLLLSSPVLTDEENSYCVELGTVEDGTSIFFDYREFVNLLFRFAHDRIDDETGMAKSEEYDIHGDDLDREVIIDAHQLMFYAIKLMGWMTSGYNIDLGVCEMERDVSNAIDIYNVDGNERLSPLVYLDRLGKFSDELDAFDEL